MSATTTSPTWARPIRALAWKEWREQRPVLLMGLLVSALLPLFLAAGSTALRGGSGFSDVADVQLVVLACIVSPVFVTATGAVTLAGEAGQGTFGFLLTRPVSRVTLWLVKVSMGAVVSLSAVVLSTAVAWLLTSLAGGDGFAIFSELDPLEAVDGPSLGMIALILVVLYASTVFFSTFLVRPITAAGAGLTGSVAILTVTFLFWSRLDLDSVSSREILATHLAGMSLVLLAASAVLFRRHEVVPQRRGPLLAGIVVAAVLLLSPVLAVAWLTPLSPEAATLQPCSLSPWGDKVAVTASRSEEGSPRVWLLPTDGTGRQSLTPRLTMDPVFSPDGSWIAYLSRRSWMGLASGGMTMRAIHIDGSGDRFLAAAGVPSEDWWRPSLVFSPDSSRVATVSEDHLIIGSIEGKAEVSIDLSGTPVEGGDIEGWARNTGEVLISRRRRESGVSVMAFDPATQDTRPVWETLRYPVFSGWEIAAGGYRHLVFILETEDGSDNELILVDVANGAARRVASGVCPGSVSMLDSGEAVAWASCHGDEREIRESEIRILNFATGEESRLATLAGRSFRLLLSPSMDHCFVMRRLKSDDDALRTIVGPGGKWIDLSVKGYPVGWSARTRLVMMDPEANRLTMIDAESGVQRPINP